MPREIVKEVKNLKVYADGSFLLRDVRFSYPHLGEPWKNPKDANAVPKFSCVGLLNKSTHKEAYRALMELINEIITKELKLKAMAAKDKCLRDGDDGSKEEAHGHWTINASAPADRPPSIRGKDAQPMPRNVVKSTILPGYRGDMLLKPWPQNNQHGKKVNCDLIAVQFRAEDEVIGEGRITEEDIDDTFEAADDEGGAPFDPDDDDL